MKGESPKSPPHKFTIPLKQGGSPPQPPPNQPAEQQAAKKPPVPLITKTSASFRSNPPTKGPKLHKTPSGTTKHTPPLKDRLSALKHKGKPDHQRRNIKEKDKHAPQSGAGAPPKKLMKEGQLSISFPPSEKSSAMCTPTKFTNHAVKLFRSCKLVLSRGKTYQVYKLLQCNLRDDLIALVVCKWTTAPTATKGASISFDLRLNEIEIICQAFSESETTEWLMAFEMALHNKETQLYSDIDCLRGSMLIRELSPKEMKTTLTLAATNCLEKYNCFYYGKEIRIRGIDGPFVSTFTIIKMEDELKGLPNCFVLHAPGCSLLIRAENESTYGLWTSLIREDMQEDY